MGSSWRTRSRNAVMVSGLSTSVIEIPSDTGYRHPDGYRYRSAWLGGDGDLASGRFRRLDRHGHGQDPVLIPGGDVLGVRAHGEAHGALQHPVPELAVAADVFLLAAFGADVEDALVDHQLDVLTRIQPRQLGPQGVVGVRQAVLDPDHVAGPDREV